MLVNRIAVQNRGTSIHYEGFTLNRPATSNRSSAAAWPLLDAVDVGAVLAERGELATAPGTTVVLDDKPREMLRNRLDRCSGGTATTLVGQLVLDSGSAGSRRA